MTAPQPEHCGHECVCQDAIGLIKLGYRNINQPCNYTEQYSPCIHDTRQRNVPDPCKWGLNSEYDMYETGCDRGFQCIDGDIEENGFKFCPYCGGRIELIGEKP